MLARLFKGFKRGTTTLPLGRWNTIVREKECSSDFVSNAIERNAFWGNHDHCGSEICKTPVPLSKKEKQQKDLLKMIDDPHFPFIL
jgi:hypothetical protein